ncbi:PEP/pyruvate-binding domain-containing protein, partial [Elusimicrobiota bacterium]
MEMKVPGGFAVTTTAYLAYLEQQGIRSSIEKIAKSRKTAKEKALEIKKIIKESRLDQYGGLGKIIMEAFKKYKGDTGAMWFAIRSAALQEDTEKAAYAGMGSTHLYVGEKDLLEKMTDVEASVWNERAIIYRDENKVDPAEVRQAVAVQEMVDSEVAGIMFTQDPVTGNPGRVVINTSYGLGETVVSGIVNPDQYELSKETGEEVKDAVIGTKRIRIVADPEKGGTKTEYIGLRERRQRSLTTMQTKALAMIGEALEEFYGSPQDIEFGIKGNTIYLLQSRPITAKPEEKIKIEKELMVEKPAEKITTALHQGTLVDMVKLLAVTMPFYYIASEVYGRLQTEGAQISRDEIFRLKPILVEGTAAGIRKELKKLDLGVMDLFNVLLDIYLRDKETVVFEKELEEIRKQIEDSFNAGVAKKTKVIVYEGPELIEGQDKFMLSPYIVKPDGTAEFHINKLLLRALHAEHGEKDKWIKAIVDRETTLLELIKQIQTDTPELSPEEIFEFAHKHERIQKNEDQNKLMKWAASIIKYKEVEEVAIKAENNIWRLDMSWLIERAADKVDSELDVPDKSLLIKPEQIHIVGKFMDEPAYEENGIIWMKNGEICIQEEIIRDIVEDANYFYAAQRVIEDLMKAVIVRDYFVKYFYTDFEKRLDLDNIERITHVLHSQAKECGFKFNYADISEVDKALVDFRRILNSDNMKVLMKKYGARELVEYELEHVFKLIENKNIKYIAAEEEYFIGVVEAIDSTVFTGVPKEYALYNKHRLLYMPEGLGKITGSVMYPGIKTTNSNIKDVLKTIPDRELEKFRSYINRFDRLINANFAALELLFKPKMTRKVLEVILEHAEVMAEEYYYLGKKAESGDNMKIRSAFRQMKKNINKNMSHLDPQDIIPDKMLKSITDFQAQYIIENVGTLHELINLIHQQSFKVLETLSSGIDYEFCFEIDNEISVINAGSRPWLDEYGSVDHPLMRSVLDWNRTANIGGRVILGDRSMWTHVKYGDHSAGIYIDPSPPDEGGMFRISYAEGAANTRPEWRRIRVAFVKRLLENLGMKVEILGDNEFINAVMDKDSGARTSQEIMDAFHTAMSGMNSTYNIDQIIEKAVVKKKLVIRSPVEVAKEWADIFTAENDFPFRTHRAVDEEPSYVEYKEEYKDKDENKRKKLRRELNKELVRLGLPRIPRDQKIIGQRIIDKYFNEPISRGVERGEYIMEDGQPEINPEYIIGDNFVKEITSEPENIMFVCTGNVFRSYAAETVLKDILKKSGKTGINVFSRGVAARPFAKHDDKMEIAIVERAFKTLGLPSAGRDRTPLRLSREDVEKADIIFAIDNLHKELILRDYPEAAEKVHVMDDVAGRKDGRETDFEAGGFKVETYLKAIEKIRGVLEKYPQWIDKSMEALQAGTVVKQLDGYINFETIGGAGRYLVQRGSIETAAGLLDIYALRDIDTNTIRYARVIEITTEDGRYIRNELDPVSIHKALDRERYETGPPQEITKAEYELAKQKLHAQPYAEILGDTVRGIASSPGTGQPVTGIATYRKDHKKKQGKVLIAPYTEPDDVSAIKESKAVITTGGGTLAHAGITTREFGIPSAIISSARWEGEGEYRHIVLSPAIPGNYKKTKEGIWTTQDVEVKEIHIKEGDIITVDGLTGAVMPVSNEYQDEIKTAYVLLEKIKAGLPKKGIKKVLMGRAYPRKLVNKFEELGRMLKKTKNFELI